MSELRELLVDGAAADVAWPMDRGLLYGDGLFETLRVQQGRVRLLDLHAARLAEGCRRLGIGADLDSIWNAVRRAAVRHSNALLRLQVTRGRALVRGYATSGEERARWILAVFGPDDGFVRPEVLTVCTLSATLGENPLLAGLKHCNRLEQVLARQAMAGGTAFEGLMASSSGLLISGTMSNVFLELDGQIVTPALGRCGVAGVMRAAVLREAGRAGVAVRVTDLPMDVLTRATALALSNARMGLVMVDELEGRALGRSELLVALSARVAAVES